MSVEANKFLFSITVVKFDFGDGFPFNDQEGNSHLFY